MNYRIILILLLIPTFIWTGLSEGKDEKNRANQPDNGLSEREKGNLFEQPATRAAIKIGQWTKYQIKRYRKDLLEDTPSTLSEADIKISIIGKETVVDKDYFWVEFVINEGKEEQRIVRLMVDENGDYQAERLVLKYGKLPAVEIHLRIWEVKTRITRGMLFEEMTTELNIIPFKRILIPETYDESSVSYEKLPLNLPNNKEQFLNCIKVLLKQPDLAQPEGYIWYSDKVPLAGLVKLMLVENKYRTMIIISDYGASGAVSSIKETPVKLDFREKITESQMDTDKNK